MFFITPMYITNLPVGNMIQEKAGYLVYLILFLIAVAAVTYLTYFVETFIYKRALEKNSEEV